MLKFYKNIKGDYKMLEDLKIKDLMKLFSLLNNNTDSSKKEDGRYVIVRTYSAGVFAGEIESRSGREVVLKNARRLWRWAGAASLSQLAMEGVKRPDECKFPCEVDRVELLEAIEILDCTDKAKKSIKNVHIWKS
jgi:hypothetical protein